MLITATSRPAGLLVRVVPTSMSSPGAAPGLGVGNGPSGPFGGVGVGEVAAVGGDAVELGEQHGRGGCGPGALREIGEDVRDGGVADPVEVLDASGEGLCSLVVGL